MYKRYDPSLSPKENLLNLVNLINGFNLELHEVEFSEPAIYPSDPDYGFCTMTVPQITSEGLHGLYPILWNKPTVVDILETRDEHPCELEDLVFTADGNTPNDVVREVAELYNLPGDQFEAPEEFPAPTDNTGISYLPISSTVASYAFSGTFYIKIDWNDTDGCGCPLDKVVKFPKLSGWSDGTANL